MAAQAVSDLDKKLAELYSEKVTVNLDNVGESKSSLSPEDFWKSMQLVAVTNKAFINIVRR
ncbi:MAG: hypothetical protein PHV37_00965 [Candidatus Gastranaerophilales bacterium]|nr:hypothetical protein [Candidatus Gastranaerophilales bacterium]